jgi:hypothetical protein
MAMYGYQDNEIKGLKQRLISRYDKTAVRLDFVRSGGWWVWRRDFLDQQERRSVTANQRVGLPSLIN